MEELDNVLNALIDEENVHDEVEEMTDIITEMDEEVEEVEEEEALVYYYINNKLVLTDKVPLSSYVPKESREEIREYVDKQLQLRHAAMTEQPNVKKISAEDMGFKSI